MTTPQERVDETLTFMQTRCPAALINDVKQLVATGSKKKSAGEYIALGIGFNSDQRRALRSLLLCQYLFVAARDDGKVNPWGKACFGSKEQLKKYWKDKPVQEIMNGVEAYDHSGTGCLADALEGLGKDPGDTEFKYYALARAGLKTLGAKEGICYQTIALALWLGGYASSPWLSTWYASLNAGNCFDVLGPGSEVDDIDRVLPLRGEVISFRAKVVKGTQTVNHWAVIVSDGCALGSNTDGFNDLGVKTTQMKGAKGEESKYEFKWGKRRFGKFDILECFEACKANTKYSDSGGVRVALHRIGDMKLW
jgi:hypothetical protein